MNVVYVILIVDFGRGFFSVSEERSHLAKVLLGFEAVFRAATFADYLFYLVVLE